QRDAELACREVLADLIELLQRDRAALRAARDRLQAAAAGADERELGGHEEAVDGDEHEYADYEEPGHRRRATLADRASGQGIFAHTETSQAKGMQFLARFSERTEDRDPTPTLAVRDAQYDPVPRSRP